MILSHDSMIKLNLDNNSINLDKKMAMRHFCRCDNGHSYEDHLVQGYGHSASHTAVSVIETDLVIRSPVGVGIVEGQCRQVFGDGLLGGIDQLSSPGLIHLS